MDRAEFIVTVVLFAGGLIALLILIGLLIKSAITLLIKPAIYRNHKIRNFIVNLLTQMGCQPEINKEDDIIFKYQGETFLIQIFSERIIRIGDFWWLEMKLDDPQVEFLKEAINLTNQQSVVTAVYSINQEKSLLGVHCVCITGFFQEVQDIQAYMIYLLDSCFETQQKIKERLSALLNAKQVDNATNKRVKVKGFK